MSVLGMRSPQPWQ